jgi:lantibiotic modifying enzyme
MGGDGSISPDVAERDVRNATDAALAATPYSNDTLCCGVAGQADFLLEAGRYLHDRALEDAGAKRIAQIWRRWSDDGDARWDLGSKEYNLGLFRGVAGIGYAALRAENPTLPQVLVWK